jgi:hypothetical protein
VVFHNVVHHELNPGSPSNHLSQRYRHLQVTAPEKFRSDTHFTCLRYFTRLLSPDFKKSRKLMFLSRKV